MTELNTPRLPKSPPLCLFSTLVFFSHSKQCGQVSNNTTVYNVLLFSLSFVCIYTYGVCIYVYINLCMYVKISVGQPWV